MVDQLDFIPKFVTKSPTTHNFHIIEPLSSETTLLATAIDWLPNEREITDLFSGSFYKLPYLSI
jgi:hypothetical protein